MKDELTSEEKLTLGKLVQSFQTWKANHERYNDASSHRNLVEAVARLDGAITMLQAAHSFKAVNEALGQDSVNLQERLQILLQRPAPRT